MTRSTDRLIDSISTWLADADHETGFSMRWAAVILPELGTGPDTPIVVSHWFAARGDAVWEGERLVEVLVGVATFDVPAPASGRLAKICGWEDDQVQPGALLGFVAVETEYDGDEDDSTDEEENEDDRQDDSECKKTNCDLHDHNRDPKQKQPRSRSPSGRRSP